MDKKINTSEISVITKYCEQLIQIFQDEEWLYLDLIKKEGLKKEAILSRNADSLLKISKEQEDFLKVVDLRERERSEIIKKITELHNMGNQLEKISELTELPGLSGDMKEKLLHHSYALRELMFTLRNITSINQEMLEDNKRLFDSLIEELTDDKDTCYSPVGKNKKTSGPLFVNING
ncbi:MAG: flagellar protein FlgN [Spirochaetia bacterium]|nr:flagellar protein FlgN [Spirochaetia bacterium]